MDRLDVYMFAMETIFYYEIYPHVISGAAKITFNIFALHTLYAKQVPYSF